MHYNLLKIVSFTTVLYMLLGFLFLKLLGFIIPTEFVFLPFYYSVVIGVPVIKRIKKYYKEGVI